MKRRQFLTVGTAVMAAPALPSVTATPIQRTDGFWNVNPHQRPAPSQPETSGTAFFAYAAGYALLLWVLRSHTSREPPIRMDMHSRWGPGHGRWSGAG
jgi:hypothetical protein